MTNAAHPARSTPPILVASNNSSDAVLVKNLLSPSFENVHLSTDADSVAADFDRWQPRVLVLAFDALTDAEHYRLELARHIGDSADRRHRTVLLCDKDDMLEAARLCIERCFDDYVLFWPMNHDAPRLPVAIHQALRELAASEQRGPSATEFAAQARRLSDLEGLLQRQMAEGQRCLDAAAQAIEQAARDIDAALDAFCADVASMDHAAATAARARIHAPLQAATDSMGPLQRWVDELGAACAGDLEAARGVGVVAERALPVILVVDDDPFQQKLVARLLETQSCQLVFADSGAQALRAVGASRPDLVLMDVHMPGMSGVETTRQLKSMPGNADLPVIMITGQSEGSVVVDSLSAGAADFLVKPFDPDKLISKVNRWSQPQRTADAAPR